MQQEPRFTKLTGIHGLGQLQSQDLIARTVTKGCLLSFPKRPGTQSKSEKLTYDFA